MNELIEGVWFDVVFILYGDDFDVLKFIGDVFVGVLVKVDGVVDVKVE